MVAFGEYPEGTGGVIVDTDTASLQAAEKRVREMQEQSKRLLGIYPTFGEGQPPTEKAKQPDDRFLLLLLILLLSQNGGSQSLLTLLFFLLI